MNFHNNAYPPSTDPSDYLSDDSGQIRVNPGSGAARLFGCTCPADDNGNGEGAFGTQDRPFEEKIFWITETCPLHGVKKS